LTAGAAHAEDLIDMIDFLRRDALGHLEQISVVGVDDFVDVAE
jgi:hypothetical protein